jgi:hypothetical protein
VFLSLVAAVGAGPRRISWAIVYPLSLSRMIK